LKVQNQVNNVIRVLVDVGLIEGIKYILSLKGIEAGHSRKPFKNLTKEDKKKIENAWKRYREML